ncbi:MAG: methyltransferase domain-containing protein [Myxococcales bacterium]|nr:MAG: methyltransferase domain-containing protein [Myxococcales bacterium]
MAPVDWKEAWKVGRTPWDAGASAPALHELLQRELVPSGRVLVPGCGTGYDLATLARDDREVVGIDLSEDARAAFIAAHPNLPGTVVYEVTDFFSYGPGSGFDFVWDYTFFCALDPDQRGAWANAMSRLVRPSGILATLLFPFEDPISDREGPPWPINAALVRAFVGDVFEEIEVREMADTHPGREGKERLALWKRRGS